MHEQTHPWFSAKSRIGFQEMGGPRSVSGEPIEETMITESKGVEMLLAVRSDGEISKAWNVTN